MSRKTFPERPVYYQKPSLGHLQLCAESDKGYRRLTNGRAKINRIDEPGPNVSRSEAAMLATNWWGPMMAAPLLTSVHLAIALASFNRLHYSIPVRAAVPAFNRIRTLLLQQPMKSGMGRLGEVGGGWGRGAAPKTEPQPLPEFSSGNMTSLFLPQLSITPKGFSASQAADTDWNKTIRPSCTYAFRQVAITCGGEGVPQMRLTACLQECQTTFPPSTCTTLNSSANFIHPEESPHGGPPPPSPTKKNYGPGVLYIRRG